MSASNPTRKPVLFAAAVLLAVGSPRQGAAFFTTVQNDYYVANVVDDTGAAAPDSIGGFQLHTGPAHPAGPNLPLNFGNQGNVNIGTSYSGIRVGGDNARVYTTDAKGAGAANPVNNLDGFYSTEGPTPGYGGAGWRTVWDLFPEQLEITQDVIVVGDAFENSAIYHTVEIRNGGSETALVEWLNLIDFDTVGDSGPNHTMERPGNLVFVDGPNEYTHPTKIDEFVRVSDFPTPGAYEAFWTVTYETGLLPELEGEPLAITHADEYQFVAWSAAFDPSNFGIPANVFDYAIDPTLDVATSIDTAGIAKFQGVVPAGGSYRVTQAFWVRPIPEPTSAALVLVALAGLAYRKR